MGVSEIESVLDDPEVRKNLAVNVASFVVGASPNAYVSEYNIANDARRGRRFIRILREHQYITERGNPIADRFDKILSLLTPLDLLAGGTRSLSETVGGEVFILWNDTSPQQKVHVARKKDDYHFMKVVLAEHGRTVDGVRKAPLYRLASEAESCALGVWYEGMTKEARQLAVNENSAKPELVLNHFKLLDLPKGETLGLHVTTSNFDNSISSQIATLEEEIGKRQHRHDCLVALQKIVEKEGGIAKLSTKYVEANKVS